MAAIGFSKIVSYMRPNALARRGIDPNQNFTERMNAGVAIGNAGAGTGVLQVLAANDADFNGDASIDVHATTTGPYALGVTPPQAFTFIAPIQLINRTATGSLFCIYGSGLDGSGYVAEFAGADFKIGVTWADAPQADIVFAGATPTAGAPHIALLSHDPLTKTNHFAIDGIEGLLTQVSPDALVTSSAASAHPFGYVSGSGGVPLYGKHAGWALFNEAYGAGDADFDTSVAAVITAWKTMVGVA
ncbi:hypothetical protein [Sphingomonas oryzagri]|uniref:Uncharacterized protein n=1 Tax=Sphingomonas oryzagri TaxID=3042314 RepID=A0ABT6N5Z6_9SPHN|nr:hypothetical protein [Sphingomonas oryzagri]MDH7640532.1 hypothetical protein [Sphingomonas oryzagri]